MKLVKEVHVSIDHPDAVPEEAGRWVPSGERRPPREGDVYLAPYGAQRCWGGGHVSALPILRRVRWALKLPLVNRYLVRV